MVVALRERRDTLPVDQLLDLKFRGVEVKEAASLYETVFGRVSATDMRPSELVFTREFGPAAARRFDRFTLGFSARSEFSSRGR